MAHILLDFQVLLRALPTMVKATPIYSAMPSSFPDTWANLLMLLDTLSLTSWPWGLQWVSILTLSLFLPSKPRRGA